MTRVRSCTRDVSKYTISISWAINLDKSKSQYRYLEDILHLNTDYLKHSLQELDNMNQHEMKKIYLTLLYN